jgi:hypothetical protein
MGEILRAGLDELAVGSSVIYDDDRAEIASTCAREFELLKTEDRTIAWGKVGRTSFVSGQPIAEDAARGSRI